ncbi:hypothetical protein PPYR_01880 [Photinus pyralis]|uniref:DDE-1 domain-containing protein n=1 Tax=Photinus pyralis TaxID=7054 RepID=A0A5N4B6C8_PHOPY|nr:hypothetical protein PPYR_01880 [Photinus pyralis]
MCRSEVNAFFDLLEKTLLEHNLINSGNKIFNMDESGIQLNNKPRKVIATKGSKDVHVLTSVEKGEHVTLIACNNGEGVFMPPVLILKGTRKNPDFMEGLPTGSEIYMNKKSSYITSELFMKWLTEHFVPRKGEGKVVLILDGHTSHTTNPEMLNYAEANDIIIICLPSHITQALQPLDRSFFKPMKDYFKKEADSWMLQNENRKNDRRNMGALIGRAWKNAATPANGMSGFEATSICPFNRTRIPDPFFPNQTLL